MTCFCLCLVCVFFTPQSISCCMLSLSCGLHAVFTPYESADSSGHLMTWKWSFYVSRLRMFCHGISAGVAVVTWRQSAPRNNRKCKRKKPKDLLVTGVSVDSGRVCETRHTVKFIQYSLKSACYRLSAVCLAGTSLFFGLWHWDMVARYVTAGNARQWRLLSLLGSCWTKRCGYRLQKLVLLSFFGMVQTARLTDGRKREENCGDAQQYKK